MTPIKVSVFHMKYMGKTTDTFGRLKFQLPQTLPFQAKTCIAGRASKIELLMLVLDFMGIYRLKNTQWHNYGNHEMS